MTENDRWVSGYCKLCSSKVETYDCQRPLYAGGNMKQTKSDLKCPNCKGHYVWIKDKYFKFCLEHHSSTCSFKFHVARHDKESLLAWVRRYEEERGLKPKSKGACI